MNAPTLPVTAQAAALVENLSNPARTPRPWPTSLWRAIGVELNRWKLHRAVWYHQRQVHHRGQWVTPNAPYSDDCVKCERTSRALLDAFMAYLNRRPRTNWTQVWDSYAARGRGEQL